MADNPRSYFKRLDTEQWLTSLSWNGKAGQYACTWGAEPDRWPIEASEATRVSHALGGVTCMSLLHKEQS